MRVLITDPLSPVAIELLNEAGIEADVQLKKSSDELRLAAKDADGWIIRSGTTITDDLIETADRLKVIGRAGVGVDNIDLDAATRKGVMVVNAPDGNTISTAEHTCAMILALARQIPGAARSLAGGAWERKQFSGSELEGKTLGVVGVGKIGRAVAQRMQAFGMEVIGFDPVLSPETADQLNIKLVPLNEIWKHSDFVTFHTPLNDATRGLLSESTVAQCKEGVRIINIARGGIVDETVLLPALESGKIGGVALDVYSSEPPPAHLQALLEHPRVVATPHIAASTEEAQEKVAHQIVEQVIEALNNRPVITAVNTRIQFNPEQSGLAGYISLAEQLGCLASQLSGSPCSQVTVTTSGEIVSPHAHAIVVAVLVGMMRMWRNTPVNVINAPTLAGEMGLQVEERRSNSGATYSNEIIVMVGEEDSKSAVRLRGTLFEGTDCRLVGYNKFPLDVRIDAHMLFYQNVDKPGMLADVGQLLASVDVNIAGLALGRSARGKEALTVITTDDPVPEEILVAIRQIGGVSDVHYANI